MACDVLFFLYNIGMQDIDCQPRGLDKSQIHLFTMCWLFSLASVTNTGIALLM